MGPLSWRARALLMVALLALAGALGWRQGVNATLADWQAEQLQQAQQAAAAERETRNIETARQRHVTEVQNASTQRQLAARRDAAAARTELDRLRDELTSARAALPSQPQAACLERARALDDVFGSCAAALEGLAGQADRHAGDALMLREGWPR